MSAEAWKRVRESFEAALDVAPSERSGWLDEHVGASGTLREEVERLLAASEDEGFLSSPIGDGEAARASAHPGSKGAPPALVGRRFGSFRVTGMIAAGGMGAVYEAEQDSPRRRVALKTMRVGLADETARLRFDDEVRLLARLRHPAIAQVLDAGVWSEDEGRIEVPWFAMELVESARSIVAYAEEQALDVRGRIDLFREVCAGVHHGHQAGVLHRDLKPANLLVDADGHPKVIDFGVAKALRREGGVETERTQVGQMVGTLVTMSPEQVAGRHDEVDIRSDVYALGAVLYELLSGAAPFDLTGSP